MQEDLLVLCHNKTCPKRHDCRRALEGEDYRLIMVITKQPDENGECEYFAPVKKENEQ